jgi:glycosyltransferase involved in cell wall biosynthesis
VNGLLVPPDDEQLLADAIILGLEHPDLVKKAHKINLDLIKDRANREKVASEIAGFYQRISGS